MDKLGQLKIELHEIIDKVFKKNEVVTMSKTVLAVLGNEKVDVAMVKSDFSLVVYRYIDNETASMEVIAEIPRQEYSINDDMLIELKQRSLDERILKIKPILLDEITRGKWD